MVELIVLISFSTAFGSHAPGAVIEVDKKTAHSWVTHGLAAYVDPDYVLVPADLVDEEEKESVNDIPSDFPGAALLIEAGITSLEVISAKIEDGSISKIKGIGKATLAQMVEYFKK